MKDKTLEGVSIIGLGPMGQAMAKTFLEHGHSVTVWNRTAGKAENLVKKGALQAISGLARQSTGVSSKGQSRERSRHGKADLADSDSRFRPG